MEFSQKAGTWLAIAVLVLIVGGYFGVYSGLNYMKSASSQLKENKKVYQQKSDRLDKLKAFQSKIDQAEEAIALMNEALPTQRHNDSTVSILDSMAAKAGAKLMSYSVTQSGSDQGTSKEEQEMMGEGMEEGAEMQQTEGPTLSSESISIGVGGKYQRVSKFVSALESQRRPFNVETIQVSPDSTSISLTHYYLK